jgi:phospholipid transport system substrate-binding protein
MLPRYNSSLHQIKVIAASVAILVVSGLPLGATQAATGAPVEAFVQQNVDTAVNILQDKSRPDAARRAKLREFLLGFFDLKRIALFTLGSWRRDATPADLDDFVAAFRDFALANYEARIGDYGGQTLKVIGSRKNAANDYIVTTVVVSPGQANSGDGQLEVDLRVLDENGKFFLVDASVEGIWLALTQREDFSGFLGQNNGDIKALAGRVRQRAASLLAGEAAK